jgi:hypothetical protein
VIAATGMTWGCSHMNVNWNHLIFIGILILWGFGVWLYFTGRISGED